MPSGTVKWFNEEKGFGFIQPDTGGKDLFFHHTNIQADGFRTLCEDQRVSYEVTHGPRGVQANYVQSLAEGAARGKGGVEPITDLPLSSPRRESSIDSIDLPIYSSTKHYVETPETHEQLAIGDGCSQCSDIDAVVESHSKEMKEKIEIKFSPFVHLLNENWV
jgi:CspA family cold shock protein